MEDPSLLYFGSESAHRTNPKINENIANRSKGNISQTASIAVLTQSLCGQAAKQQQQQQKKTRKTKNMKKTAAHLPLHAAAPVLTLLSKHKMPVSNEYAQIFSIVQSNLLKFFEETLCNSQPQISSIS